MQALTKRQQDYLDAINAHRAQHGVSPTLREIAAAVGIGPNSTVAVRQTLSALARKGYIELAPGIHRGIYQVEQSDSHAKALLDLLASEKGDNPNLRPDWEVVHEKADAILLQALSANGCQEIAEAYLHLKNEAAKSGWWVYA